MAKMISCRKISDGKVVVEEDEECVGQFYRTPSGEWLFDTWGYLGRPTLLRILTEMGKLYNHATQHGQSDESSAEAF